jgi:hypothetical protein
MTALESQGDFPSQVAGERLVCGRPRKLWCPVGLWVIGAGACILIAWRAWRDRGSEVVIFGL